MGKPLDPSFYASELAAGRVLCDEERSRYFWIQKIKTPTEGVKKMVVALDYLGGYHQYHFWMQPIWQYPGKLVVKEELSMPSDKRGYMNAATALEVMKEGHAVTNGNKIYYYVKDFPLPDGTTESKIIQATTIDSPDIIQPVGKWIHSMEDYTFRLCEYPLNAAEAEDYMREGDSVEGSDGMVYVAGEVKLSNDVGFMAVFKRKRGYMKDDYGAYEYEGLLEDFGLDPMVGEYAYYAENKEADE